MKSIFSKITNEYRIEVIEHITDYSIDSISFLTIDEKQYAKSIVSVIRRNEYISIRILLHSILHEEYTPIQYESNGKPYITNYAIGISHAKNSVAIILAKTGNVAIDVETYRPQIFSITARFLNDFELQNLQSIEDITLAWSTKETLYKLYNASPDFRKDYSIQSFNENGNYGIIEANIHTKTFEKQVELYYFRNLEFCLVWAINI